MQRTATRVTTTLHPDELDALDRLVQVTGTSRQDVIRRLLRSVDACAREMASPLPTITDPDAPALAN